MPKSITSQTFIGILLMLLAVAGCSAALPSTNHADAVSNTPTSPWGSLPWGSLDFVQYYVALELIFEGKNPYDQELAGARQMTHGRAWGMQMFVPPWGMLPGLLVANLPFPWANYGNIGLNALLLVICAACWTKLLFPGKPRYIPIMVLASFLWMPSLVNMEYGQNALWPLAGFTGWLWFTQRQRHAVAGWLLALTIIKPHLGLLPVVFALVYSLRQRHWATLATSAGGVVALTLVTFLIRPTIWNEYLAAIQTGLSPSIFRTYTLNGMALPYLGPTIQYVTYALLLAVIYSIVVRTWKQFKTKSSSDEQPAPLVTWSMVICMMILPFATYAWLTDFVFMVPGGIYALGQALKKDRTALVAVCLWIVMSVWLCLPSWKESYWIVPWLGWGITLLLLRIGKAGR
ncbi:MAG TPA: glycosyltransferase family 87 protein [Gemmatales bacterium]|nr:glycosyltransferase family 87 protein [Gemmatales bacterium]